MTLRLSNCSVMLGMSTFFNDESRSFQLIWHCRSWLSSWGKFAADRDLPAGVCGQTMDPFQCESGS